MKRISNSQQIRRLFRRDGFVAIPAFLSRSDVDRLLCRIDDYARHIVPDLPPDEAFYNQKGQPETLSMLTRMDQYDPFFGDLLHDTDYPHLARHLLQAEVLAQSVEFFDKPPTASCATPPHQDGHYFMLEPCEAVTFWLSLDSADDETGALRYVAGSHRRGLRPHGRSGTLGFSQTILDYGASDVREEVAVPTRPGDLLVHHALCIHRAGPNRSAGRHRRSLGLVYYAMHAQQNRERLAAYQQQLYRELAESGKI